MRSSAKPVGGFVKIAGIGALLAVAALPYVAQAADPSSEQIYQALRQGQVSQAESMVEQVLADHPGVGKAHYVAAEVYARAGDTGRAREELDKAESLSPGLPFAKPGSVHELQQEISEHRTGLPSTHVESAPRIERYGAERHGFPWFPVLIVGIAIFLFVRLLRRPRPSVAGYGAGGSYPPTQTSNGWPGVIPPGSPPAPMGGGFGGMGGGGLMGNVASGLALGAGVAAGEALVNRVIGGSGEAGLGAVREPVGEPLVEPAPNADLGGDDFGLNDSSWDDGGGLGGGGDDWN